VTLLAPWALAIAAALALPAIVLLYVLKLRRRSEPIASTLLWRRSVQDLLANAPFQRLRWSMLLLLQVLAALLVALALGRPVGGGLASGARRVIILIDRSASMNAVMEGSEGAESADPEGTAASTRLDRARSEVARAIESLTESGETQVMLVAFAREPRLLCGFEQRATRLLAALETIAPTDEEANLEAALELAEGFSRSSGDESVAEGAPAIVVVTDGGVLEPRRSSGFRVTASSLEFIEIVDAAGTRGLVDASPGEPGAASAGDGAIDPPPSAASVGPSANLGFVELAGERSYQSPTMVELFARIANTSPEPVETVITVRLDDRTVRRRTITIPAAGAPGGPELSELGELGEAVISESFECPGPALLSVSHSRRDELAADDIAAAQIPAPRAVRLALVAPPEGPDPFLRDVLEQSNPALLVSATFEEWESAPPEVDLVIFDRVAPREFPRVASLSFGAAMPGVIRSDPPSGGRRVLSWDRRHPLLRHIDLDELIYSGTGALRAPREAIALVSGADGAVISLLVRDGVRHVLVGFALTQSNLPVIPAFTIFIQNALDELAAGGAGQIAKAPRVGEIVTVEAAPGASEIEIVDPDGATTRVPVRAAGGDGAGARGGVRVAIPPSTRAGVRRLSGTIALDAALPSSVLSAVESDIRRRPMPTVATTAAVESTATVSAPREWWPWVLLAALGLLVVEWLVYAWRAGRA